MKLRESSSPLSVIVPAYNEERTIKATLRELVRTLGAMVRHFEVIVVSDGSTDRTVDHVRRFGDGRVQIVHYPKNLGKGHALRIGFEHAKGDPILFYDAGGDFPPRQIGRYLGLLEGHQADVVVGSKRHPDSVVVYPWWRRLMSASYQLLIRLLFNLTVRDTQVGFKLVRRRVLERVLPRLLVKAYAFDLEFLVVAHHLGFTRIVEAPITLRYNFERSGVNWGAVWRTLWDTAAVAYRLYLRRWYDRPHRLGEW